ncbi:hypothetical protein HEP_00519700, partial [Hepatocystis sp. ex Piliocolobus tephrosceles]
LGDHLPSFNYGIDIRNNSKASNIKDQDINISALKDEVISNELLNNDNINDISLGLVKDKSIHIKENEYVKKKYDYILSPERADPLSNKSPAPGERTYTDVMLEIKNESTHLNNNNNNNDNVGTITSVKRRKKERWGEKITDTSTSTSTSVSIYDKIHESGSITTSGTILNNKKNNHSSKWDFKADENETSFGDIPTPAPNKWVDTPFVINNENIIITKQKKKKI